MMKKYFTSLLFLFTLNNAIAQLHELQWARVFEARNQFNATINSNGRSVAADQLGNVYSAGVFDYTTDFDPGPGLFTLTSTSNTNTSIYISKLSADGDFLWAIQIPTYVEFGNIEIRVDRNNNVCIASELRLAADFDPGPGEYILRPTGIRDAFVAKYDSDGKLIWAKQFGGAGSTTPAADVLEIDRNNNVIVCGNFNNTVDFDPGPGVHTMTSTANVQSFIVKLKSNGDFMWAKQFGNSSAINAGSNIADVKCDLLGNIYVTGDFSGTCDFNPGTDNYPLQAHGKKDGYAARLDNNGNFVWARSIGNTTYSLQQYPDTKGIDLDADGNVYIAGNFIGTFDFDPGPGTHIISSGNYDWYVLKLNQQGDFVWVDAIGGTHSDIGADVAVSNDGYIYAVGTIGRISDMDAGPGEYIITTINQFGASAIVKLNSNGNFIAAGAFDQVSSDYGDCLTRRLVVDDLQNIYITGYTSGLLDFDPNPAVYPVTTSTMAPFVLKMAKCVNITTSVLDTSVCNSFTMGNELFDSTGTYVRTLINSRGCDSIVTLHLTINKKITEQNITICQGESFFAAGVYQTEPGSYKETFTSSLNCDSIVVTNLSVSSTPAPALGPDGQLCAGEQPVIDPGSFAGYLWQDMSTSSTFIVDTPGLYWVKVTNEFNCTATDSILVTSIVPAPYNFLKNTDSICNYLKLDIAPDARFDQYLWSTGAADKQIRIDSAGIYRLTVTAANGCKGTDSITIYPKHCLDGVYFPNAFVPGSVNGNNIFRAKVFEKLVSFRLQVFNRQGQLIFETGDPLKGWDGTYKGKGLSTAAFVWQCYYQVQGERPLYRKGTLMLIR